MSGRGTVADTGMVAPRDLSMMRTMWTFLRPYGRLFAVALGLLPLISACLLAQPWIIKQAIDECIMAGTTEGLGFWGLAFGVAIVCEFSLLYAQHYVTMLVAQNTLADLRVAVFDKIQSMDTAYFDRNPVGRLVTRMTTDVDVINEMFAAGALTMIMDVITLVGIVSIMMAIHFKLALVSLAALPLMFALVDFFRRKARRYYRLIRERIAHINAYLQESITGISIVQLFAREEKVSFEFDELNAAHRDANHRSNLYEAALFSIVEGVSNISIAGILWYGAHLVTGDEISSMSPVSQAISFGTLVAFMEYINKFFIPVRDFSTKYAVMQSAFAAAEKVFAVLELKPAVTTPAAPVTAEANTGSIEFRNVCFSYIPGEPVLRDISFLLKGGEHLAIVGATGSGKTTVTKLIARFYDVESGSILVDGIDVRDWDLRELRSRIVTVLQDVFLFGGTIEDNVSLHAEDITTQEVTDAIRAVGAESFVQRLPSQLREPVRERGNNFSSGQRQLISFARALAYKPKILVLDEATSSVDPETEELIQEAVTTLQEGRSSLVIAHRLSTIEKADRILVLHHGELREQGPHAELMIEDGLYAKLYRLQNQQTEGPDS